MMLIQSLFTFSVRFIVMLTTQIVAKAINLAGEEREVTLKFNE